MNAIKRLFMRLSEIAELGKQEFAIVTLEDGTSVEIDDATGEVFILDADGARVSPAPDGEHTLSDGTVITVLDGKIVEPAEEPEVEISLEEENRRLKEELENVKKELEMQRENFARIDEALEETKRHLSRNPRTQIEQTRESKFEKQYTRGSLINQMRVQAGLPPIE